jgi:hypothetical protein
MYHRSDLTYTELHFAYHDDVVVGPGPSHLSIGICRVADLHAIHLLGVDSLDRIGLATILCYGHELCHVLLHQLMDYGCFLFGNVLVYAIVHLLLHIIHPFTPCSTDDDSSHASDHRGQRGRVKYGGHLPVLLPTCA